MKSAISKKAGYQDPLVNTLARDTQRALDSVLDLTVHPVTVVWAPPMNLNVPYFGGEPRLSSPAYVECKRAKNLSDPTILVTPGTCSFEWIGSGQVRIDAAAGLTTGQKYELVFAAVG